MPAAPPPSRSRRARSASGVTRLEVVVVVAVTALMGTLAASALRTYFVRAEIAESIAFAKYAQDQVTRAFRRTGAPPADRAGAGLTDTDTDPGVGRYVAETAIVDGRIDLLFGPDAHDAIEGRTLSLTPFETADRQVVWICGNKTAGVGLKPLGFAGGARLAVQTLTKIEPRYLPAGCR